MSAAAHVLLLGLGATATCAQEPSWESLREAMVESQIVSRGVRAPRVLDAMRTVPRHLFVPPEYQRLAYEDHPVPIGHDQTISQPYIVAAMTELLKPAPSHKVLEVGTGSGYQAAVLSRIVRSVISIEIVPSLADQARIVLTDLGYTNVTVLTGDGFQGYAREAPYDGIIVTAAPEEIPPPLVEQLAVGGRLVIPVGTSYQELIVLERTKEGIKRESAFPVRFVPMTGEAQKKKRSSWR